MTLLDALTATADPVGNRVVLTWRTPDPVSAPWVRVVRRHGAYPQTPRPETASAGVIVADSGPGDGLTAAAVPAQAVETLDDGRLRVVDADLAEGVWYYQVFPYTGPPAVFDLDPANQIAVAVTAPYGFADRMWRWLPALYHRFDTTLPVTPGHLAVVPPEHHDHGQLRRFLELPGGQLDQLSSDVRSLLHLHDLQHVDGQLLPLLAAWIGWRTDHRLGYDRQRAEIRDAPALYQAIGTAPAVDATVHRIAGWRSRTREFIDNVFLTTRPEQLCLWLATRDEDRWEPPDAPLSLDASPDGRPAAVQEPPNAVRLVYHTNRTGLNEIRSKRHTTAGGWEPSTPVVARSSVVDRDPAVARQDTTTWVFWSAYDPAAGTWRIDWRTLDGDTRGPVETFRDGPDDHTPRRGPAATVDRDGALWLFWHERGQDGWRVRYARFDGTPWAPTPATAVDFPDDGAAAPRVEADLTVAAHPLGTSVEVLWASHERPGEEQTRWRARLRHKSGLDPHDTSDWSPVTTIAQSGDPQRHDREPVTLYTANGVPLRFISSTRDGGWSLYEITANGATQPVAASPFSQRAPLPLALAPDGQLDALCYRSNRAVSYDSRTHRPTSTTDLRACGSTTVRAGDAAKLALRGTYDDFTAYTYDTGRGDDDWYARDTVGVFVDPGDTDPPTVAAQRERLHGVLREFVPATTRTIVITPPAPA